MTEKPPRRVVITGALSGMGEAAARMMTAQGMRLALLARRQEPLEALARQLDAHAIVADLADWNSATAGVEQAIGALGGIDALVNCAGTDHAGELTDLTEEQWCRLVAVNLTGPVACCRAAIPALRQGIDPAIVNIGTAQALLPSWKQGTAYSASKGGLISFTKSLAKEVGPEIRANLLCPGTVDTPMYRRVAGNGPAATSAYALERIGTVEEMAEAILFMATERSSLITGTTLAIDAGRTFH